MNQQENPSKLAYTITEAVQATGLSRTAIYEQMKSGALPFSQFGVRRLIRREALETLLKKHDTSE